ncbi:MAG: hypothetical protein AAF802_04995 [Planctomycetota bacterium]
MRRVISVGLVVFTAVVCALFAESRVATAQPPGTFPPPEIVSPSSREDSEGLEVGGFLLYDELGIPILMPRASFEEAERLFEMKSNELGRRRLYFFEGVQIDGAIAGERAELSVQLELRIEATRGETIEIPLAMENFHRLGAVEILAGADTAKQLDVGVDGANGGYQLVANMPKAGMVKLKMKMSARIETEGTRRLDFRLPAAPTQIAVSTDQRNAVATIPNRDDEVLSSETDEAGRSRFVIESSGGRFTLQWGAIERAVTVPLLDSTSSVQMVWNAPEEQLIQTVRMTVRDERRPIASLPIRLPPNAVLRDEIRLVSGGQFGQALEFTNPDPKTPELLQISIPKVERRQSATLEFQFELPVPKAPSGEQPLRLSVPQVDSAIRNQGSVSITTGSDYRLRWRDRPYVRLVSTAEVEDASASQRVYEFQFVRGGFELPLWLDATQRELRITSTADIELRDDYFDLALEIESVGSNSRDQLLSVDLANWVVINIENARTGAPLYWYESDGFIEIETNYSGMEESNKIRITADRSLSNLGNEDVIGQPITLSLPRVVGSGDQRDPVKIQSADVRVSGGGRQVLVIDLEASESVERMESEESDAFAGARVFSVMPPESKAKLVGRLVNQPPRLVVQPAVVLEYRSSQQGSLAAVFAGDTNGQDAVSDEDASPVDPIDVDPINAERNSRTVRSGDLKISATWDVESQTDLEGRLRIAVPIRRQDLSESPSNVKPQVAEETESTDVEDAEFVQSSFVQSSTGDARSDAPTWTVLVNGLPAEFRPVDDVDPSADGLAFYDVISDALAESSFQIRFDSLRPVDFNLAAQKADVEVGLPFPLVDDVSLRGGFEVQLLSDDDFEVSLSPRSKRFGQTSRVLPKELLGLQISPKPQSRSDLTTGDVVIRTATSELSQHDQVIVVAEGSGELALTLRRPLETDVEVRIDSEPASYRIARGTLYVRVPETGSEADDGKLIDVRLWSDRELRGTLSDIRPLVKLGIGSRMAYWQLTTPASEHLVWATPSLGRLMTWANERWRLVRQPLVSEATLVNRVAAERIDGIELSPMPNGNRYLFSSLDDRTFEVRSASQSMLWLCVAGIIICLAVLLTYWPAARHPLTLAVALVAFTGFVLVAPDAAIITGQIAVFAMTLVVVMLAIRSLILPRGSRVLSASPSARPEPNKQGRISADPNPRSSATYTIGSGDLASAADEVAT